MSNNESIDDIISVSELEYVPRLAAATHITPVSYDPRSRLLVVSDGVTDHEIRGVHHATIKTWCKMRNPDSYFRTRIKDDPRIKSLNAPKRGRPKASEVEA